METQITIERVWGKVRNDRYGVVVTIRNRDNIFKWLPTYEEVKEIIDKLKEVEEINKNIESVRKSDIGFDNSQRELTT